MNLILILMLFYNTNFVTYTNTAKSIDKVKITIVDEKTSEKLVGVLDKKTLNYSDINGQLLLNNGNSLNLNLISYEEMNIKNIRNDTIIKMKPL